MARDSAYHLFAMNNLSLPCPLLLLPEGYLTVLSGLRQKTWRSYRLSALSFAPYGKVSLSLFFFLCSHLWYNRPAIKTSVAKAPVNQIAVPTVIFIMHLSCLICKL
jgi:hypothetical protein